MSIWKLGSKGRVLCEELVVAARRDEGFPRS